jgi:hypothetical protein
MGLMNKAHNNKISNGCHPSKEVAAKYIFGCKETANILILINTWWFLTKHHHGVLSYQMIVATILYSSHDEKQV